MSHDLHKRPATPLLAAYRKDGRTSVSQLVGIVINGVGLRLSAGVLGGVVGVVGGVVAPAA